MTEQEAKEWLATIDVKFEKLKKKQAKVEEKHFKVDRKFEEKFRKLSTEYAKYRDVIEEIEERVRKNEEIEAKERKRAVHLQQYMDDWPAEAKAFEEAKKAKMIKEHKDQQND